MKKKYRIKTIEEKEKVSTQDNKEKDWHKQKTKVYMETSWEKNNQNKRLRWAHNLEMKKKIQKKEDRRKQKGEHAK
jgi:hypothetical protein